MTDSDRPHAHVSLRSPLPSGGMEVLPARREGTRFRLESSPISIMGLAADDLIEVSDDGSFVLVEPGGMVCVQVFIERRVGGETDWFEHHLDDMGSLDSIRASSFVINVPSHVGHGRTMRLMDGFLRAFPGCFFQYGNVYERAPAQSSNV